MIQPIKIIVLERNGSLTEHSRMIILNKINEIIQVLNNITHGEVDEKIKPKIEEIKNIFK